MVKGTRPSNSAQYVHYSTASFVPRLISLGEGLALSKLPFIMVVTKISGWTGEAVCVLRVDCANTSLL